MSRQKFIAFLIEEVNFCQVCIFWPNKILGLNTDPDKMTTVRILNTNVISFLYEHYGTCHWSVVTVIRRILTYTGPTVEDVDDVPYRYRRIITYTGNNCCICGQRVSIEMNINLRWDNFCRCGRLVSVQMNINLHWNNCCSCGRLASIEMNINLHWNICCRCGRLVSDDCDREDQGPHGRGGGHP